MLGKPQWFKRRKYGGWGFWPCCWQGWIYLAILLASFMLIQILPFGGGNVRLIVMIAWAVVFAADATHIMISMPRDEREKLHEALAERNALWAMVVVLCAAAAYQAAASLSGGIGSIDPAIFAVLGAGLVAKAATNVYLDAKD